MPEVMDMTECAQFLGYSRQTLRVLSRRELDPIPFHRATGTVGDRRYIREEVLEWLKRQPQ
ncbi:MAG: helix-turn-helix domain-containing protein [Chloroflexota bacterium]|nr:helix-turn-helix domain-containing protein [Chloroflexota bacterium]